MADILITGGGGGIASSEDTTAQSPQVLENYTYLGADTDDDVGTGTMLNRSVVGKNNAVGISSTYPNIAMVPGSNGQVNTATNSLQYANIMVPEGYYNGSTYVGIAPSSLASGMGITANKIAQGQTIAGVAGTYTSDGTATNDLVYPGKVYYSKGQRGVGSMPTQGGSTITPGTAAKTAVAANRYVTGNVTVAGDGNLVPGNIKKNVTIFGVRGTWEGYVADTNDLFDNGVNAAGFTFNNGAIQDGAIKLNKTNSAAPSNHILTATNSYPFGNYTYLNIDFYAPQEQMGSTGGNVISLRSKSNSSTVLASYTYSGYIPTGRRTFQINISGVASAFVPLIYIARTYTWSTDCYIYRIWLS